MTKEQKYHRRLSAKYGQMIRSIVKVGGSSCLLRWGRYDVDYRGKNSLYEYAKSAAWHAFQAHPELREDTQCLP